MGGKTIEKTITGGGAFDKEWLIVENVLTI
jgi:hypothetical protein